LVEPFEPPKYISSLIASINDGAKAAQTGALAFAVVGFYLIATAVSTTDEDLFLQHTTTISQLGVQVPAVVSFAVAPIVLVALHVFTLIRYNMLGDNLRHFRKILDETVPLEVDREHCRQLLANVEYVVTRSVAPRRRGMLALVWFFLIAIFPVLVLFVVQISSLRYQSYTVLWAQRFTLLIDLLLLGWFFRHQRLRRVPAPVPQVVPKSLIGTKQIAAHFPAVMGWQLRACAVYLKTKVQNLWAEVVNDRRFWARLVVGLLAVLAVNVIWLNIPEPDEETATVRVESAHFNLWKPLDAMLCPTFRWGCRYLELSHRTLVTRVWTNTAIAALRDKQQKVETGLAGIEPVSLRGRLLRFINLDESRLFGADLKAADLRKATLIGADLSGANLRPDLNSALEKVE
jgi:hypothetical protein